MPGHAKDVDILGYKRGEHQDGPDVCSHYVFDVPGRKPGVYGWNDTCAVFCARCGRRETEHVIIRDEVAVEASKRAAMSRPPPAVALPPAAEAQAARAADAARERQINRSMNMLDTASDPLYVAAPQAVSASA
jgi:hypothetical protein